MGHRIRRSLVGLSLLAMASIGVTYACVPADDRPPPGALTVTVSPSQAVQAGVVTTDGWSITFERVLVGIGSAALGGDCNSYSEANYDRILDVAHDGAQKLSILHGLGQCDFRFRIGSPSSDALLGVGVSEADKSAMREPGTDPYLPVGGVGVDMLAVATRGGTTKRFHLLFRPRVRYQRCVIAPDSGVAVDLRSNDDLTFDIRIEGEAILRDDVDASGATLRFEPFANADKDGNGEITLDELRHVPLGEVRDGGAFEAGTYEVDDAGIVREGKPVAIDTLGDFVYLVLVPTLPRFRDVGGCAPNVSFGTRGGGRGPGGGGPGG